MKQGNRTIPGFRRRLGTRVAAVALAMLTGCNAPVLQGPLEADPDDPSAVDRRLDHGYALLLNLLSDEAKVADILAIKSPRPGVAKLLRDISKEARTGRRELDPLLSGTPPIDPSSTGLPLLERDARRRIANEETPGLLLNGGRTFETRILLTQQKAAQYARALCESLATADPDRTRSELVKAMGARWAELETATRRWLTVVSEPPEAPATTNPATVSPQ